MHITAAVLQQHEQALRDNNRLLAEQIALQRLTLPTVFGMKQLRAKWPALSEAEIKALLERHCGYQGRVGVSLKATIDQVMKIDAVLTGRLAHA